MEKELVNQPIGKEVDLKLELKDGMIELSVAYDGKGLDGIVMLKLSPAYFLDKLKNVIPGKVDDAVIDMLKASLALK